MVFYIRKFVKEINEKVYLSPLHTTKFSLTSFLLTSFICSCVQHKLTSFSLTRSLVQKLVIPDFEQGKLSRTNCYTHEQIKLVKEKLLVKACSLYTRASKATKELVNENYLNGHRVCGALRIALGIATARVLEFSTRVKYPSGIDFFYRSSRV